LTAQLPNPAPPVNFAFVDKAGLPTQAFRLWVATLDVALRSFFGAASNTNTAGAPLVGPLVAAGNDAAAAAGGVPINGLYRNGSVVQIRVT
jgi:hypothetical protein